MTRILVVDDEQSIRRTFDAFLACAGYAVETAENVEAAQVRRLEQGCFDIRGYRHPDAGCNRG